MRTPRTGASAVAAAVWLTAAAAAQTFVSPTGDDVTGDGSPGNPYRTISHALTQTASGGVIQLLPGTFGDDEQILVGTDMTIVGSGVGVSTVRPNNLGLTRNVNAGAPPGTPLERRIAIHVANGARCDVRDLTLDGAFRAPPAPQRFHALVYHDGADGTVHNVRVTGFRLDPNTPRDDAAVLVRGDDGADPSEVAILNSRIDEIGRFGIHARFDATVRVEGNDLIGGGAFAVPGAIGQTGIFVADGASGTVRGNTVVGLDNPEAGFVAAGIRLTDAGSGCAIEINRTNRCEAGIVVEYTAPSSNACLVLDNKVTEGTIGILNDGSSATVLRGNVLHRCVPQNAVDETGATWDENNFGDWSGAGPYTIAGSGGAVDANPRRGNDELGAPAAFAVGGSPIDLEIADLDGANGLDFVTLNLPPSSGSQLSVTVGLHDGAGGFTTTTTAFGTPGLRPVALALGDFHGTGDLGVVVVTEDAGEYHVLQNDGSGGISLQSTGSLALPALGTKVPTDVTWLPATAQDDSFAVSFSGPFGTGGAVMIIESQGGGAFAPKAPITGFARDCTTICYGDFGGSPVLRALAVGEGGALFGSLHVIDRTSSATAATLSIAPDPTSVDVLDVDGDGDADIVVASRTSAFPFGPGAATVLCNDGAAVPGFAPVVHRLGIAPQEIALGSLGDDGGLGSSRSAGYAIDLIEKRLTALLDGTPQGFAANLVVSPEVAIGDGTTPTAARLGDMDGDASTDVVVADATNQRVIVIDGVPRPRVDRFGVGCPGTAGRVPRITAFGAPALPRIGNAGFGVEVTDARPSEIALLLTSFRPPIAMGPCDLLIPIDLTFPTITDLSGTARFAIPVPDDSGLAGGIIRFQWVVVDPSGQFTVPIRLSMSGGIGARLAP